MEKQINAYYEQVGLGFEYRQKNNAVLNNEKKSKKYTSKKEEGYYEEKCKRMINDLLYMGKMTFKELEKFSEKTGLTKKELAICKAFEDTFYIAPYDSAKRKTMGYTEIPMKFGRFYTTDVRSFLTDEANQQFLKEYFPEYQIKNIFNEELAQDWFLMELNKEAGFVVEKVKTSEAVLYLKKELNRLYDEQLLKNTSKEILNG